MARSKEKKKLDCETGNRSTSGHIDEDGVEMLITVAQLNVGNKDIFQEISLVPNDRKGGRKKFKSLLLNKNSTFPRRGRLPKEE